MIYINVSFDFLSQNHLIFLGFSMNMNVYMHLDHMLFTTFASVLYRIYNFSPSVRACISDTTRPLMLYIVLVISLIIHDEKTKEINLISSCNVVYLIQNSTDLDKLFFNFLT